MQPKSPHEDFCAELTRDLQDDPELRRDVSRELEAHLDDAVALARSRGLDETAAEAEAMEHFGPASGLPQMLIEGNLSRMKSRARAKILIEWVLIPLCLIAALFIGWRESRALNGEPLKLPAAIAAAKPQTPEEERAMALRELTTCDKDNRAERFARVRQLDPDNGWIDWMELTPRIKDKAETQVDFPELLTKAEKAFAKPRWDEGVEIDLARRFRGINAAEQANYMQRMSKVGVQAAVLLPALGGTRYLSAGLAKYGTTQCQQGNISEADRAFRLMDKLLRRTAHCQTLIEALVAGALGKIPGKTPGLKDCLKSRPEWAVYLQHMEHVEAVIELNKKVVLDGPSQQALCNRGSTLHKMLIPAMTGVTSAPADIYDPGRRMEYAMAERVLAMISLSQIFTFLILLAVLTWLWRFLVRSQKPFLPLPRFNQLLRHIGLTCVLPIVLYELYKMQSFSSHAWGPSKSLWFIVGEQVLLLVLLPLFSCWLWQLRIGKRLESLGVAAALRRSWPKRMLLILTFLGILGLMIDWPKCLLDTCLSGLDPILNPPVIMQIDPNAPAELPPSWLRIHLDHIRLTFGLLSLCFWLVHLFHRDGRLYRACLGRAILPLLALWILALGLYIGWLRQQEEFYGARDTLMNCSTSAFSTFEEQAVAKFRRELLKFWPEENR